MVHRHLSRRPSRSDRWLALAGRSRSACSAATGGAGGEPPRRDRPLPVVVAADPPRPRRARDLVLGRPRHDALGHRDLGQRRRLGLRSRAATPRHRHRRQLPAHLHQPGTYDFQCKLHPTVRGTVVVSSTPGDPNTEADPVPKSNVDLTAAAPERRRASEADASGARARRCGSGSTSGRSSTPSTTGPQRAPRRVRRLGRLARPRRLQRPSSAARASTSTRSPAATWPSSGRATRATTPARSGLAASRSASRGRPRSPRR